MRTFSLLLATVLAPIASAKDEPIHLFRGKVPAYGAQAILHEAAVPPLAYRYNVATGGCVDSASKAGLNDPKVTTECADFRESDQSSKDFSKQNLRGANFDEAKVKAANFKEADLRGAKLNFTNYKDADFKGALISPDTELPFSPEKALNLGMIWVDAKMLDQLFVDYSWSTLENLRGLVALGANAHAQDDLVLKQFIRNQNVERLTVLKKLGLDMGAGLAIYFAGFKADDYPNQKAESKFVQDLIGLGANLDYSVAGESLLASLVRLNRIDLAKELVAAGASLQVKGDQINVLTAALEYARYPLVFWLLEKGADPNLCTDRSEAPLSAAVRRYPTTNEVAQFPKGQPTDLLDLFLKYGADPNTVCKTGISPLAAAFERAQYPKAKKLLSLKADPNICDKAGECSVLSKALSSGATVSLDAIQALVTAGADGSWGKTKGINLLDRARGSNLLAELVRAGADVKTARLLGRTDLDSVKYLIEQGANIEQVDGDKITVLMGAIAAKNQRLVEYLLKSPQLTPAVLNAKNSKGNHALIYVVFYLPTFLKQFLAETRLDLSTITMPVEHETRDYYGVKKKLVNVPVANWALSRPYESQTSNQDLVKLLGARGASLNAIDPRTGVTLLHSALGRDHKFLEELIALGADPKEAKLLFTLADRIGSYGHDRYSTADFIFLLDHGADPNASDRGQSIAQRIASCNAPDAFILVEKLLDKGAKLQPGLLSALLRNIPESPVEETTRAAAEARKQIAAFASRYGTEPLETETTLKQGVAGLVTKACVIGGPAWDKPLLTPNKDVHEVLLDYLATIRKGSFKTAAIDEALLSGVFSSQSADGLACERALYALLKTQFTTLPTKQVIYGLREAKWRYESTPAAFTVKAWEEMGRFLVLLESDGAPLVKESDLVETLLESNQFPMAWTWFHKGAPFKYPSPKMSTLKKSTMTATNFNQFGRYGTYVSAECGNNPLAESRELFAFAIESGGLKSTKLLTGTSSYPFRAYLWDTLSGKLRIEELSEKMKDLEIEFYCREN
jgi:ankyrin repeat protein